MSDSGSRISVPLISIYERIGGAPAIAAVVERFHERVSNDRVLRPLLAKSFTPSLKRSQERFFTEALGGPDVFRSRDAKSAHARLRVGSRHVERVTGHLVEAMRDLDIPAGLISEITNTIGPLNPQIVEALPSSTSSKSKRTPMKPASPSARSSSVRAKVPARFPASKTSVVTPRASDDLEAKYAAIVRTQAVIEFNLDGTIITANENFLSTLGYRLEEIQGKHHSMFVDVIYRESQDYKQFWAELNEGKFQSAEFRRFGKGGKEVWIQATYTPIFDENDRVVKVVKFATDISKRKFPEIEAINRAQATIEFKLDGTIVDANANFLNTVGYTIEEIRGKHHSMFVDAAYRDGGDYKRFWRDLNDGKFQAGEFRRVGKGGREIWIQASYNPIFNLAGNVIKVVKFASDITEKRAAEKREKEIAAGLKITLEAVNTNAQALATASEELSATAQQMSSNSEETSTQANVAAAAAEQVSKNVATVATSAEEMSATAKEIAKNAAEAAKVATTAVKVAEDTSRTVNKLGESSIEIGKVIKVITSIAQQTNLLALNATIEAARAGEAGKGFAVVANEVKELAKQTAAATEDISGKIEAIQSDTKGAVTAITQISGIISQINGIQTTIASAVEEQTATTNEIARNAGEAATGSTEIARNIGSVSTAARNTSEGAANTLTAAGELARLAADLKKVVDSAKL